MFFLLLLSLPFSSEIWLSQFEEPDQPIAVELVEQIDYFSHERICHDLKELHRQLLTHLKDQEVVYSRTYVARSGDLISYFYRTSNRIPSVLFKNLSDPIEDKGNKVLVLLDDYVGTGTQFLFRVYAKEHWELFNRFRKVYFVTLVANTSAIQKFDLIKSGSYEELAHEFITFLHRPKDEETRRSMVQTLERIPKDRVELVYLHEEKPLSSGIEAISALIDKYGKYSLETNFFKSLSMETYGHTAFFYSCPNNLPAILWDSKLFQLDGNPWIPLLNRAEDISIYERAKDLPLNQQVR